MKIRVVLLILFLFNAKASPGLQNSTLKSIPLVDALLLRLQEDTWPNDADCMEATLQILYGVKNDTLWATWVWDSMQMPLGAFYGSGFYLGNYDQCLKTPWSSHPGLDTQYCLVEATVQQPLVSRELGPFDSADEYLTRLSKSGRNFNQLVLGACMPSVCSPSSIGRFYRHLLRLSHLPHLETVVVKPQDCQGNLAEPYPEGFYTFLSVMAALVGIAVISTTYLYFNENEEKSTFDTMARSFSIVHNWGDLFKQSSADIHCIHGMRVLTATAVVLCHQGLLSFVHDPSLVVNGLDVDALIDTEFGQALVHLDLVVDTFFAFSGLLLAKSLLAGKQKNLILVLLKRYFRLIGPYAVATFYIMFVARHTARGPIWLRSNANEEQVCEEHWWKNFFMMSTDIKTMCFGVAWYVTCDYHLSILSVLLFWIYRRNKKNGERAFAAVSVILTAQLAVMAYRKGLPLAPFSNIHKVANIREYNVINDYYIKWHDRAGPYLTGLAVGWLMTAYQTAKYRHTFDKVITHQSHPAADQHTVSSFGVNSLSTELTALGEAVLVGCRVALYTSYLIVMCSVYAMLKVVTINYWMGDESPVAIAIAIATCRVVWAVAICAVIGACEYGNVPIISHFLGSTFFVPLSKLSYGIYMTHFFVLQRGLHVYRTPLMYDLYTMNANVLSTMVLSAGASLLLYLLVEAPCTNLSNLFLSERRDKSESCLPDKAMNGSTPQKDQTKVCENGNHSS